MSNNPQNTPKVNLSTMVFHLFHITSQEIRPGDLKEYSSSFYERQDINTHFYF